MNNSIVYRIFLMLLYLSGFVQTGISQECEFNYRKEIQSVEDDWHTIDLPLEIYDVANERLTDLRIYEFTDSQDTVEVPYLLDLLTDHYSEESIAFQMINESTKDGNYYYTFKTDHSLVLNEIQLHILKSNYDWRIQLQGSNDNVEWFTIIDNYRIVSLNTANFQFEYSTLKFPKSEYRYWRLWIPKDFHPYLNSATLKRITITEGKRRSIQIESTHSVTQKETKQTVYEIQLSCKSQINGLNFSCNTSYDYYRPYSLEYLSDSVKKDSVWVPVYSPLTKGVFCSWLPQSIDDFSIITSKLRLIVDNFDNEPLAFDQFEASGYVHQMRARFNPSVSKHYLYYGSSTYCPSPSYDISYFEDKIPQNLTSVSLGETELLSETAPMVSSASSETPKYWIWILMTIIGILLAVFSFKFLRERH